MLLIIWLRDEGLEADVRKFVKAAGGDFDKELANLYVSDFIAKAILDARPGFASKPADVRLSLQKQFPRVTDVSIDEMIVKIKQALGAKDKLPVRLLFLTKYSNTSRRCKSLQGRSGPSRAVLLKARCQLHVVATGQNALSGVPLLQRLQGRFPVTVELQDTDVEQVTREVVLKKKPSAESSLKKIA